MDVALAVPPRLERRLVTELVQHGHTAVARCDAAAQLTAVLVESGCDAAVVAATPDHLDQALLAASDGAGVRVIALVGSDAERRHAHPSASPNSCRSTAAGPRSKRCSPARRRPHRVRRGRAG